MPTLELITPSHLNRKALIYIRQSTPQQALTNQESLRLQYGLQERALALGWRSEDIATIDTDLGKTAALANTRAGFKELVTQVTLGEVGIILSSEATRLSRNFADWYALLDICGYKHCLIADQESVYDPSTINGRLLLGLKGQLSELELHTIRARLNAGLLNKAQRGELALPLPTGFIRQEDGQVVKDPNQEVQARLELVFNTFLRVRSASQTLRYFNEHDLYLPRQDRFRDIVWKKPRVAAILSILKNPTYAGAFVYGRSRTTRAPDGKITTTRLSFGAWKIVLKDKYPAYISWETFEQIQAMLKDNYAEYDRNKSRGVPKPGAALLHGLVYCGECGHKMLVQYKTSPYYLCLYLRQQYQVPVCQRIPTQPIDDFVVNAFFQAFSAVELDAYEETRQAQKETADQTQRAQTQQLDRLRYEAELAARQFKRVDPENRLVAAELEKRWETALRNLKQAEESFAREQTQQELLPSLPADLRQTFRAIGQKLPEIWDQETLLSTPQKKAVLRTLIDKVVIHRHTRDQVQTCIVWKGGAITTAQIAIPVGSFADLSTAEEMEQIILEMSRKGTSDEEIAQHLTALGHRSPMNPQAVLLSTVRIIRLKHRIFRKRSQSHPRQVSGYLTVPQIAEALAVTPHWLYGRMKSGRIKVTKDEKTGLYLFPDHPDTLDRFRKFKDGKLQNLHFS